MQWRSGTVERELQRWAGAVVYAVRLTGAGESAQPVKALAYTDVVGDPHPGDTVLLNATALMKGLGTGGLAFIVAVPCRLPPDPRPRHGHIVKARYTPQQQMVLAVDEPDSPYHDVMAAAEDLGGVPVVVADLHSAVPAIVAGVRAERPGARVAYVMTDGGALPAAFSRTVSSLRASHWVAGTITVGQAYGGDYEAVSLHSGLLAAVHVLRAEVVVVAQGPGNVGTGTPWGFSGAAAGEALNAAHVLGGHAVASLRVSEGDARPRHRGISHHSRTAYGRVALVPATVPVPRLDGAIGALVAQQAQDLAEATGGRLTLVEVAVDGLDAALRQAPVRLSTMGRGLEEDAAAFLTAAAAGRYAAGAGKR